MPYQIVDIFFDDDDYLDADDGWCHECQRRHINCECSDPTEDAADYEAWRESSQREW